MEVPEIKQPSNVEGSFGIYVSEIIGLLLFLLHQSFFDWQ